MGVVRKLPAVAGGVRLADAVRMFSATITVANTRRGYAVALDRLVADFGADTDVGLYKTVVLPRVRKVISQWPDAAVLSGFRRRLESDDLSEFLGWRPTSRKLTVITGLTAALHAWEIETVRELAACYDGGDREQRTRRALRQVTGVGPKTVDYIAILTGSTGHVAVDTHLARFVRAAGAHSGEYRAINALITQAASELGCSAGALDAAIWNYMSSRERRRGTDA